MKNGGVLGLKVAPESHKISACNYVQLAAINQVANQELGG